MTRRPFLPLATALLALSMAACNPQTPEDDAKQPGPVPTTSAASGAAGGPPEGALSLADAIAKIPKGDEKRDGYERDSFKHWTDEDQDGCPTRAEVLIEEATTKPEQGERCTLTGGAWTSSYDNVEVTDAKRLDIDHMVPLAEAWDSGAHAWSDERRQAYANDLTAPRSLIAVTAKTNRSKGDKDPADWLPRPPTPTAPTPPTGPRPSSAGSSTRTTPNAPPCSTSPTSAPTPPSSTNPPPDTARAHCGRPHPKPLRRPAASHSFGPGPRCAAHASRGRCRIMAGGARPGTLARRPAGPHPSVQE